jgi:hypothetical protein
MEKRRIGIVMSAKCRREEVRGRDIKMMNGKRGRKVNFQFPSLQRYVYM